MLYLSNSHKTLDEQETHLIENGVSYIHIHGLADKKGGCPCLVKDMNGEPRSWVIANLFQYKFSNKILCSVCKKHKIMQKLGIKECRYKKQFKHMKRYKIVLAPIQYIYYKVLLDKFQPTHVILDDCIDYINPEPSQKKLTYQLLNLACRAHIDLEKPSKNETDIEKFSKRTDLNIVFPKLKKAFRKNLKKLAEQIEKNNSKEYDSHFLISPEFIENYIKKSKLYGFKDRFAQPAILSAVDYVVKRMKIGKKVEVKLVDAEPPFELFEVLSHRYKLETGITVNFQDDGFKSKPKNVGSKAYKIGNSMQWFPYESIRQERVQDQIKEWVELLHRHFFNNNPNTEIAVIFRKPKRFSYMTDVDYEKRKIERMRHFIPKRFKNVKIATFGNVRSQNDLEHCDVLYVIGTYVINSAEMSLLVNDWFPHLKSFSLEKVHDCPHGGHYPYVDKNVDILRKRFEEYEMYQVFHRVRPTLSPKLIFAFCCLGDVKQLEKDKIEVESLCSKIHFKEMQELGEHLVDFVLAHNGRVARIFAEEMLNDQYGYSKDWAQRKVLKLVRNNKNLKLNGGVVEYVR